MVKFDPHRNEERYKRWRYEKGGSLKDLTQENTSLILEYLDDMEVGANVSPLSKRGPRSYIRLRNLKFRMYFWAILFQKELGVNYLPLMEDKERELLLLVKRLREGLVCGPSNRTIKAPGTYIKVLKAFWHWFMRIQKKKGITVNDITIDLDSRDEKPKFNYITIEDINKLCKHAAYEYRTMMMFLLDSGIRAPTELMNTQIKDLEWNEKEEHYTLNIREEISKTFGRKIKLLLCSALLKEYIKEKQLRDDDFLFRKPPAQVNQYLKTLGYKILGIGTTSTNENRYKRRGKERLLVTKGLTMYDFRHASACYWLPRYKSESALKYRFGWKKSEMIHYYTELLGMKDTITNEDLYVDTTKTELEKNLQQKANEITILQEQLKTHEEQMKELYSTIKALQLEKMIIA